MPQIRVVVDNSIKVLSAPPAFVRRCKGELTFDNPAYVSAVRHNRSTYNIPKKIRPYEEVNGQISLPRGFWHRMSEIAAEESLAIDCQDESIHFDPVVFDKHIELRDYQTPWVDSMLSNNQGIGIAPPGCHRKGTRVILADGSVKKVEDVVVGDRLAGPSGHNTVVSLCRGTDTMYRISPKKGSPFYVNGEHLLSLVLSANPKGQGYKQGQVVNIKVNDWLRWPKYLKEKAKLYRCSAVEFSSPTEKLPIDPYFLGVLLGNGGLRNQINVTTADVEIVEEIYNQAHKFGVGVRVEHQENNASDTYFFQGKLVPTSKGTLNLCGIRFRLRSLGLLGTDSSSKFVPCIYKTSTLESRLQVIAGLLDTNGNLNNNCYDWVSKSELLAEDFCFLARSCGLAANKRPKIIGGTTYWRVFVSGETSNIPCRIQRKKATARLQKKNALRTGFTVEKVADEEEYFGFQLNGDHLYLLEDFTVTHNSGKTVMLLKIYEKLGVPCLWITHTGRLARQTRKRAEQFLGVETGIIGKGKEKLCHFTVGMVQTLVRRDLSKYASKFGLIVVDECHHQPSKTFTDVVSAFKGHYRYGATATPYREDGLQDLMFLTLGPPLAELNKAELRAQGQLMTPQVIRRPTKFNFPYNPHGGKKSGYMALADALATDPHRNRQIATDVIVEASIRDDNICIVLVGRIPHGEELFEIIKPVLPDAGFVHSKMSPKKSDKILDDFESGRIKVLIATYKMLAEGFDYQPSNRLFLTAPFKGRSLIEQACGRIERTFPGKTDAVVFDYVDRRVGVLDRQAEVRLDVYESNDMPVSTIT